MNDPNFQLIKPDALSPEDKALLRQLSPEGRTRYITDLLDLVIEAQHVHFTAAERIQLVHFSVAQIEELIAQ